MNQQDNHQPKAGRLWSLSFCLILLVAFVASMNGNGVHNGVTLLVEDAGQSSSISGIITAGFCFSALVARLFTGALSDRIGRKPVMLVGGVIILVGCALGALTSDVWLMLPSRALMGFGFSMVITCTAAAVADTVPPERLGEGIGYQGLAFAIAMAVGPTVAGSTAGVSRLCMFGTFFVLGVLSLTATAACKFSPQPKADPNKGEPRGANPVSRFLSSQLERAALRPAAVCFLCTLPLCVYMSFMSLFAQRYSIDRVSWFFFLAAVIMLAVRLACGKLFDRWPVNRLLIPAIVVGGVGLVVLALHQSFSSLMIAGVAYGIYCGIMQPILTTDALRRSPMTRRGAASSTFYISCDVGMGCASLLWGFAINAFGFPAAFAGGAAVCVLALFAAAALLGSKH